ncbi:UNVERIFIED_CONTAM: hypothetical protein GTU68_065371 [Idotea baltica]|nr:hypothetical protein [Idotea baltica]
MLIENQNEIAEAISQDYGNRSQHETLLLEIFSSIDGINHSLKQLKKWMKVQRRHVDFIVYPGAKNRVIPQPLGVIGMIVPWNFPINLSFVPLTSIFAAGNSAMIKMSENSISLTRLMQKISPNYFPKEKLVWIEETGGIGIEFSKLKFDKILFTGSGQTGRAVMKSASDNLTPVVLELGGKSPAIIDPEYPMDKAVERIMYVKQLNAGQICTAVDYVFVREDQQQLFVEKAKAYIQQHCPDIENNDYTAIIDDVSFKRLEATLQDAEAKGATLINLSDNQTNNPKSRKIPLYLVLNPNNEMDVLKREIFGPILPIITYKGPEEVVKYVNSNDQPLALYPFTKDKKLAQFYIDKVMSGGVSVNDALFHVGQHDLPFGGVGPSGMGHYHGYEGFASFSKLRPVFYQANISFIKYFSPPYKGLSEKLIKLLLKFKS